ncbi:MAG: DUF3034 family protein [Terracidiphilus sp.]|nr:DUF3034 family protein [Terracidiphilus sp.]
MNLRAFHQLSVCVCLSAALLFTCRLPAQNLTLEGYTGGFITPTAYVVNSEKGHFFSHPAVGYHFLNANAVIGDIHTFGIAEGFGNRAEVAYARSVHLTGDSALFSSLWHYAGMNVFSGKVVAIQDGQFRKWAPGVAVGGIVRTGDHFVSGAIYQKQTTTPKTYSNGDVYVVATKTRLKAPVPFLATIGYKFTNAEILGIGGQATRFGGRFFGGLGIPLPGPWKTAIVPSAGFMQEPKQVQNLSAILINSSTYASPSPAHIPTTLDYAIRITQREHAHFSFDIGVGQVAGTIGTTYVKSPPLGLVPVNLNARHVIGTGLSYRY